MQWTYQTSLAVWLLTFSMVPAGCSRPQPQFVPVEGIVLLNGKALGDVQVTFSPEISFDASEKLPTSTGVTNAAGRFQLVAQSGETGAIAGSHIVSVLPAAVQAPSGGRDAEDDRPLQKPNAGAANLVPAIYRSLTTSPVRMEVSDGQGPVEVRLSSTEQRPGSSD